jgi:hypothetical protein
MPFVNAPFLTPDTVSTIAPELPNASVNVIVDVPAATGVTVKAMVPGGALGCEVALAGTVATAVLELVAVTVLLGWVMIATVTGSPREVVAAAGGDGAG